MARRRRRHDSAARGKILQEKRGEERRGDKGHGPSLVLPFLFHFFNSFIYARPTDLVHDDGLSVDVVVVFF